MELPLTRYQNMSINQIQDKLSTSSLSLDYNGSRIFRINGGNCRTPFTQFKCSMVKNNLHLKPKPKPSKPLHLGVEEKPQNYNSNSKDNYLNNNDNNSNNSSIKLCDQIKKLVFCKRYLEALELFEILEVEGGHEISYRTYDALVNACIGSKSIRGVKRVSKYMFDHGFELDQYMGNRVLFMYVKCGMLVDARKLFDEMPERNLVSWNMMIAGVVDAGDFVEAYRLFFMLWSESCDANSRTFTTMIRATAGLGLMSLGRELHSCVVKTGDCDDVYVACALIDMYSKCGSIEDAQFVFDAMPEKSTVGWNSIIAGYALHGYSKEALKLNYEMLDSGVPMDHFTFSIVIRICVRLGSLEHAKQAHAGVVRHGFSLDTVANTTLVDLYSKWGRIEDARNVFDKMPSKNLISWNALIAGYGNHGLGEEAVELFEKMLSQRMRPNHVTFLAVLSACSYSGLLDHGWKIFDSMSSVHKINPRAMHYACMIELLGREGLLDEALALIRDAPFDPTINMWAALLKACRFHKNLELGRFAAEKLYGMGPEKLSNYVVLLNIYNSMGKLEDAASVIRTMKKKGLTMLPACTWIEIKKQSHSFCSGGKSHEKTKEIYQRLEELLVEISKHEYTPDRRHLLPDVDKKEERMFLHHSEKLAVAFGLISTPDHMPLQLMQSHRICSDCHNAFKLIAKVTGREIVLRDASSFHRFKDGNCSCGDYW